MANSDEQIPNKIRVSLGSAITLGLLKGKIDAEPTTAYLMTYKRGKCSANCGFCPQARRSSGRADLLSRISWPVFATGNVLDGIGKAVKNDRIRRVCIQALNYPKVFTHLIAIIKAIRRKVNIPVSVSCQPLTHENLRRLNEAGAERIGIPLDAATEKLFDKVKGFSAEGLYDWKRQFELLGDAVRIFGEGLVSTHLIVGLGETEREMVEVIQRCVDMGVFPALFAFTPIQGTAMENVTQPSIESYRRIQVARHLIVHGIARYEDMRFDAEDWISDFGVEKQTLTHVIHAGTPFLTSGCSNCNRPYYNEKPGGPIYNYPRKMNPEELSEIEKQLDLSGA